MKMTASDYLQARGWVEWEDDDCDPIWIDPIPAGGEYNIDKDAALTIQRARDAAEERAAWSCCMSSVIGAAMVNARGLAESDMAETAGKVARIAGPLADATLAEFRARFAVEITDESAKGE